MGIMAMLTIIEYAERIGRSPYTVRNDVQKGKYTTAIKKDGKWLIDENDRIRDHRVKTGEYVGWRKARKG